MNIKLLARKMWTHNGNFLQATSGVIGDKAFTKSGAGTKANVFHRSATYTSPVLYSVTHVDSRKSVIYSMQ